jgi:hypothetical protein
MIERAHGNADPGVREPSARSDVDETDGPRAERLVYGRLRAALPEQTAVLPNVRWRLRERGRVRDGEADVVIADPERVIDERSVFVAADRARFHLDHEDAPLASRQADDLALAFGQLVPQYQFLNWIRGQRRASIIGGAGTGKTLLAIEKAQRLAREG